MPEVIPAQQSTTLAAASLENPLYYLENMDTVVHWTLRQHTDLLQEDEITSLTSFLALPLYARALLVRMITRTRELFRLSQLSYREIPQPTTDLIVLLEQDGWLDTAPTLTIDQLFPLFRKAEIYNGFATRLTDIALSKNSRKALMLERLAALFGTTEKPISEWLLESNEIILALTRMDLFERIRLMFFGNLRQSWSEFVVTELGHLRYEAVLIPAHSRAFTSRAEVDTYLTLHQLAQELEAGDDGAVQAIWDRSPKQTLANSWLDHRRRRLLFRLGHQAERTGDTELALHAYRCCWNEDARIRYFRLQEKVATADIFFEQLVETHKQSVSQSEQQLLSRIIKRVDKTHPLATDLHKLHKKTPWTTEMISLQRDDRLSVENLASNYYSPNGSECFYVENSLFNSLLGLLIWPALFSPVIGAFFHPFQSAPADLYRAEFVNRRRALIEQALETLDNGDYREHIRYHWQIKYGISCPLVHWPLITEQLLDLSLNCIPAVDMKAIFQRLLSDLRNHRSGFPDLIRFQPNNCSYELIEVKGPGDRLQDHQKLWLRFFTENNIPVRVCHVTWADAS